MSLSALGAPRVGMGLAVAVALPGLSSGAAPAAKCPRFSIVIHVAHADTVAGGRLL
jgi:hypothetical protein